MRLEDRRRCVWMELCLVGTGIVCLVWWGVVSFQAARYQTNSELPSNGCV